MDKIRVLVIDDSPLARQVLAAMLGRDAQIKVVAVAGDARFGREKLGRFDIDVVTLDLEMPEVDGLSFLKEILSIRPIPIVVVSAFTPKGSSRALRALELGAVDVIGKPERSLVESGDEFAIELIDKVKAAAKAKAHLRSKLLSGPRRRLEPHAPAFAAASPSPEGRGASRNGPVILFGASTGGCEALLQILAAFPRDAPPVICVQHISPVFSRSFAERLDSVGELRVGEAHAGDVLEGGRAYVAPGGRHLFIIGRNRPTLELRDGPLMNRHRPSIDVTFRSAAAQLGRRAIAAILTGMGDDGVDGLCAIHASGGFTLAQDASTSVVFGMPREAIRRGAAEVVAPLENIAGILLSEARRRKCP